MSGTNDPSYANALSAVLSQGNNLRQASWGQQMLGRMLAGDPNAGGVSNLAGAVAGLIFKPTIDRNAQNASSSFGQSYADLQRIQNGMGAGAAGPSPALAGSAPAGNSPASAAAASGSLPANGDLWGGAGVSSANLSGPNANALASLGGSGGAGGFGAMMGALGGMGGGGKGGGQQQDSYTPARYIPGGTHMPQAGPVGVSGAPTATHPVTGQRIALRGDQWHPFG